MPRLFEAPQAGHNHNRYYPEAGMVECTICGQRWGQDDAEPECQFEEYVPPEPLPSPEDRPWPVEGLDEEQPATEKLSTNKSKPQPKRNVKSASGVTPKEG